MPIQYQSPHTTIFESALYRTTATVFHNDDLILIVDPNWLPAEVQAIRNHVDQIKRGQPIYLLFTHSDYDHIIAYRLFDEATVIASKAFSDNPNKAKELEEIRKFDDKFYITRPYPIEYPKVDIIVEKDGQQLRVGETTLTFQLAPGHNPDGLFTYIENAGTWIVGDYLSNVEFPFIYHSTTAYLATLQKATHQLESTNPKMLVPGHGSIATDAQEIRSRIQESQDYIEQLQHSLATNAPFDLDHWLTRYPYPKGLRPMHNANVELMKTELNP